MKSELERILNGIDVDIPGLHRDDPDLLIRPGVAEAAATQGGPGLAAASAAAVAQSSAAAAPSSAPTYMGRSSPMPLPLPPSSALYPRTAQPSVFDMAAGDEAEGSGGARRASAMEALAQVLLHRPRK